MSAENSGVRLEPAQGGLAIRFQVAGARQPALLGAWGASERMKNRMADIMLDGDAFTGPRFVRQLAAVELHRLW